MLGRRFGGDKEDRQLHSITTENNVVEFHNILRRDELGKNTANETSRELDGFYANYIGKSLNLL